MRHLLSQHLRRVLPVAGVTLGAVLAWASPAMAAGLAPHTLPAVPLASVGSLLGSIVGSVIGGISWTVNLAASFILNLVGGLVKDLIPRSWVHQGLQIMQWLVAVPDYAGKIPGPGGAEVYGFPGVNAMRELYMWLGIAILPLTLLYATSRAWTGQGDHVALPLMRAVGVSAAVTGYTWLWGQAVALANLATSAILSVPAVTSGIYKMFALLVTGTALAGLDLVGELLMLAGALALLGVIFLKVVIVLIGALVYAVGPLMIGLAPTERGHAIARTWASLAIGLFAIGVLWAGVFAIAAVLVNDAGSGGALIGGGTSVGKLLSGIVIAMAAIAGFFVTIKLTKALAGVVAGQLAGMLAQISNHGGARALLNRGGAPGATTRAPVGAAGASLRGSAARATGGVGGALGAVAPAGRAGAVLAGASGGASALARGGLLGAGGALAARGIAGAARSNVARAAGSTRAGAVATRIARGGREGWTRAATRQAPEPADATAQPVRAASDDSVARARRDQPRRDAGARAQRQSSTARTPPVTDATSASSGPRSEAPRAPRSQSGPPRSPGPAASRAPQPRQSATGNAALPTPPPPRVDPQGPVAGGADPFAQRQAPKPTRSLWSRFPRGGKS